MSEICKIIRESGCICENGQNIGYITAIMINRSDFQRDGMLMGEDERSNVQTCSSPSKSFQTRPNTSKHAQTSPNTSKSRKKVAKGWSSLGGGNVNEHDIHHYNAL